MSDKMTSPQNPNIVRLPGRSKTPPIEESLTQLSIHTPSHSQLTVILMFSRIIRMLSNTIDIFSYLFQAKQI